MQFNYIKLCLISQFKNQSDPKLTSPSKKLHAYDKKHHGGVLRIQDFLFPVSSIDRNPKKLSMIKSYFRAKIQLKKKCINPNKIVVFANVTVTSYLNLSSSISKFRLHKFITYFNGNSVILTVC